MSYIIDAHEDLAYNMLSFGRNYLRSAAVTRAAEQESTTVQLNGYTLLGWPEYQRGQVAAVFSTVFTAHERYGKSWETMLFRDVAHARQIMLKQFSAYHRLAGDHPDEFRLVLTKKDLAEVINAWEKEPASLAQGEPSAQGEEPSAPAGVTHPVGLVILMEGLEGIRAPKEMEEWWEQGARIAGPVWAGSRFCGGTREPGGFTSEGYELLEVMAAVGYTLDISHMNEESALQALDRYEGPVIASHANVRALIKDVEGERHLTDRTIRQLVERGGVMGVIPFNHFLKATWSSGSDRSSITLHTLAAHIDHICQIAGDALHAAIGTDFDGGFGWPDVPYEINTIADLPKLGPVLAGYGYNEEEIANIFGGNWHRHLERTLPAS